LELLIASEQKNILDLGIWFEKLSLLQSKAEPRKAFRDQIDQIPRKKILFYTIRRLKPIGKSMPMELIRGYSSFQEPTNLVITIAINLSLVKERAGQL